MKKIDKYEFEEAYKILENSFPAGELRPYKKMKQFFKENRFQLYGIYDKKLVAVLLLWEFESFVFIENFAVLKRYRGKGYGSIFLEEIKNSFHKLIILEVEKPYDKNSENRIKFYQKNGFYLTSFGYVQPPLNKSLNEYPLLMMSYPKGISEKEFIFVKNIIFKNVYEKNLQ